MKPRASASFCHWPNDSSTPHGHVGPSCVSRPDDRRATTSPAPARSTAVITAGSSACRGGAPQPNVGPARELKGEKKRKGAGGGKREKLGGGGIIKKKKKK